MPVVTLNQKKARVRMALARVEKSKANLQDVLQSTFRIGAQVTWSDREYVQRGVVLDHFFDARLQVKNSKTGTVRVLSAWTVSRA